MSVRYSLEHLSHLLGFDLVSHATRFAGILVLTYGAFRYIEAKRSPLNAIPTIGHSGVLSSYLTAFKWLRAGPQLVQEGYDRYPNGVFKVATISKWIVILTGQKHLDELRKASDDILSFEGAVDENLQVKYTLGDVHETPYQIATVKSSVTRNLALKFDEVKDEIMEAFKTYIPASEDWITVPAYETLMHIVCRTSNRYFVGLPLCRDPGYMSLQEQFTIQVVKSAAIINLFPNFLKPIVGNCLTVVRRSIKRATDYLGPMIEERISQVEQHGIDWAEKPNDLIDWLLENAPRELRTVADIVLRILAVNFAAIHTSTGSCTQSLYDLAAHPEYLAEMREEAENAISAYGWTKSAMQHMRKIDSFLKESQRLHSMGYVQMLRKAKKDWTLSNGTVIPAGAFVGIASHPMHQEESSFPEPNTFKGFRFSELRDGDGGLDSIKHQMVALTLDTVVFGHGRHACSCWQLVQTLNLDAFRFAGIFVLTYGAFKYIEAKRSPLSAIPTIGYSGVFSSNLTAFKWLGAGPQLIQEGYDRIHFRSLDEIYLDSIKWIVILTGQKHLNELRKASDDILSFEDAAGVTIQAKYTLGDIHETPYRITTVKSSVTRNLALKFDEVKDEIMESFKTHVPASEDWITVPAYETLMHIVCRTSNRYFVGLPLCRDPGYMTLQEQFATQVVASVVIINLFPDFLKPIIGNCLTVVRRSIKQATGYLGPTIEERISQLERHGSGRTEKRNDLIDWLLENAPRARRTIDDIVLRILAVNFAAIHTSTVSCTQSLYDLATHPEYLAEMHEEAEEVINAHGWTKAAMQHMRKIDSFLKESQRLHGTGYVRMHRKAKKDWTLSDGTDIPADAFVGIASHPMHREESSFPEPDTFKGFRFSELRDGDGELDSIKHQMVALTLDTVVFGHGRHACPRRFFAVNEIKAIFAYCIMNYDVQLEGGSMERPSDLVFESHLLPDAKAKLRFRKRSST
ncbi:hypothetical protein D9756_008934 [Leucocoprinus leucothites]|uniref:Cytochrome P450 n=1 Tax=Leucocoprinus leucothites TaxID=201217 RepID=A0A8H5CZK3_9AGAR|nr:hypothetical protein D9756_008934 [Leucoagaricus leucothites]